MERVAIPLASRTIRAAFAPAEGRSPAPGVIVIHEALGLNRDIAGKARRLARMGYGAVAPDLLDGRGPKPLCIARVFNDLRRGEGEAFATLDATRAWLTARADVDGTRIGVIGFCMGGGFALLYATRAPLGAAAVFYGAVPDQAAELEGVCPVVGGYGAKDRVFGRKGELLGRHLDELGVAHDVVTYEDAGHSYMSDHRSLIARLSAWGPMQLGYNEAAAEDSWRRIEAFFGAHL